RIPFFPPTSRSRRQHPLPSPDRQSLGRRSRRRFVGNPRPNSGASDSPEHRPLPMANQQTPSRPWIMDAAPYLVVLLIAAHVFALVYWIYRLATEKQPQRRKAH
ncbi:hypothetical protein EUGRSUZ_C04026, partial [Eucalyptus grandis]